MNLIVEQKALKEAISAASRASNPKSPLPILSCLHMEAAGAGLTVSGADYELQIARTVEARIEAPGAAAIPAKVLSALVDTLPDGPVHLEARTAEDHTTTLHLTAGLAEFELLGLPAEEFPPLPILTDAATFEVPAIMMKSGFERVTFAAGDDPSRPQLTGINLVIREGQLKLAGAQISCLSVHRFAIDEASECDVILPMKAVTEVMRHCDGDEVFLAVTANQAQFTIGPLTLISKLIAGNFPNFEKIIPKECAIKVVTEVDAMRASCKRVLSVSEGDRKLVFTIGSDGIRVNAQAIGTGRGEDRIDAAVTTEGEPLEIALDGGRILDLLARMDDDTVEMEFNGSLSPVVFHPGEEWVYVLMPMVMV